MSVSEPGKIITPWAESGLKNPIPPTANPATGRAGFDQGFSAINMTAKEAGGIPPFGQDFNGIFYEVTNILRYMQAGGQPTFSSALATAIGGYPKGAMVLGSDGVTLWQSKVDSNSTDPNIDPSDWGTFDIGLKADLAAPGGSDVVGFQQAGSGSVPRTSQDKMRERITPKDKGAVGDGVTNDQAAFDALEAMVGDIQVDMLGKTYLVTTYPGTKSYFNGRFITVGDSVIVLPNRYFEGYTRGKNTVVGTGAAPSLPANPATSDGTANVVVGDDALRLGVNTRSSIAIGTRAMYNAIDGKYNVAIGLESLFYVNADGSQFGGTRNVVVGDNSGRFITTGYQIVASGRNAGQAITTGYQLVAIGNNAMAGRGSLKFQDTNFIQNQTPITINGGVAVGESALYFGGGNSCVGIGRRSLELAKPDAQFCIAIGSTALSSIGKSTSMNGKVVVVDGRVGTFSMTANSVLFTLTGHGLSTGYVATVTIPNPGTIYSDQQFYTITVTGPNTFEASEPYALDGYTGSFTLVNYATNTNQVASPNNIAIGVGSMFGVETGRENFAGGTNSNAVNTGGSYNVSIGDLSMRYAVGSSDNVALGHASLRQMQNGTNAVSLQNCVGIGRNSAVSGDDQVQIGNSAQTTYVFGTVQNRSDARDKTDVRDTSLGIEFIMGLRPVDGRWDMRDDYWEEYDEQVRVDAEGLPVFETKRRQIPKDGSRARQRKHHWFIAQEVKELCDKLGVDFGGYQDHSINDGCDVLSLGYDEFIPPTVKAVQQCWTRLDELEKRIAALE